MEFITNKRGFSSIIALLIVIGVIIVGGSIYLLTRPSTLSPTDQSFQPTVKTPVILLLVDKSLYDGLVNELNTYKEDIKRELGFNTLIKIFSLSVNLSEIKSYVSDVYNRNQLNGVLVVGNLPTGVFINVGFGTSAIYSDRIYQDVYSKCDYVSDAYWNINGTEGNGAFNILTCGHTEKFWIARLTPNSSTVDSLSLLKNYFDRNHQYRTGGYSYQPNLLLYAPQYLDMNLSGQNETFAAQKFEMGFFGMYQGNNYKIIDIHSANPDQEYLNELKKPNHYEAVVVAAHGLPTFHQLDIRPNNISESNFFMMVLGSCSVGDFTQKDYLAGHYLFNGNGLLTVAATQPTLGRLNVVDGYYPLTKGLPFFKALEAIAGLQHVFVFGDPTLKMRNFVTPKDYQPTDPQIKVSIDNSGLEFAKQTSSFAATVFNKGNSPLEFYFHYKFTDTPKNLNIGTGSGVDGAESKFQQGASNVMYIVAPHKEAKITAYLYFDKNTPSGNYQGIFSLYSNDPVNPFINTSFNFSVK